MPEFWDKDILPTPHHLYAALAARGRTHAYQMDWDVGVRTLLTPCTVQLRNDGVWLHEQLYDAAPLLDTGILHRSPRVKGHELNGYVMALCVRHVWVEVKGRLYQLEARLKLNDYRGQTYMSLSE